MSLPSLNKVILPYPQPPSRDEAKRGAQRRREGKRFFLSRAFLKKPAKRAKALGSASTCSVVSSTRPLFDVTPRFTIENLGADHLTHGGGGGVGGMGWPFPIVLVNCWKVSHCNAKELLPKFQKLPPKFLDIFI